MHCPRCAVFYKTAQQYTNRASCRADGDLTTAVSHRRRSRLTLVHALTLQVYDAYGGELEPALVQPTTSIRYL